MTPPKTTTKPKVKLADLDDRDRAALLAELRDEETAVADVDEAAAAARNRQIAELLDDRDHLRGCPGGRVEAYASRKPANPATATPASDVTVARCVECGGSTVIEESYAIVVARLETEAGRGEPVSETA